MPSTVYKGDLAEVSFASETGLIINASTDANMAIATVAGNDFTTITFSGESNNALFDDSQRLRFPKNMLVGSQVKWTDVNNSAISANDTASSVVFTIVANDGATMKITPAMVTVDKTVSDTDIDLHILPYKSPPIDPDMTLATSSVAATESCKIDQFLGIAGAITLPETKVDLKRFHVVGLGRDTSVQVPGKFITEGGSFEVAMHSARWLKYCLGQDLIAENTETTRLNTTLNGATEAGQSHIVTAALTFTDATCDTDHASSGGDAATFGNNVRIIKMDSTALLNPGMAVTGTGIPSGSTVTITAINSGTLFTVSHDTDATNNNQTLTFTKNIVAGGYIEIEDTTAVSIVSDHEPDGGTWAGTFADEIFDKAQARETRRVIAADGVTLYLDEPLTYPHDTSTVVNYRNFDMSLTNPPSISSIKEIDKAVTHLIYSKSTLPSFCMEVSQRRRDVDANEGAYDGTVLDTKELVRVYRGCKVSDFSLTTDNDAALKLSVNFNSALCWTDTGRLEATPFPRYSSHRMFDDTANTHVKKLESGIGTGTQKPFMFYNGTINIAGIQAAQVLNFTLTGQTGLQGFHVINGSSQANVASATAQVPFGGSRNTSLMVEGQTSYEMTMEVVVDDPIFYHKMRTATDFSVSTEGSAANRITIDFEKSTSTGDTERMMIIIDEYAIIEAPLQIPEDKGAVKSMLKIMPKAIKVIARDTIIKY